MRHGIAVELSRDSDSGNGRGRNLLKDIGLGRVIGDSSAFLAHEVEAIALEFKESGGMQRIVCVRALALGKGV